MNRMLGVVVLATGMVQMDEPIQTRGYAIINELTTNRQLRVPILNGYMPRIKMGNCSDGTERVDYDYRDHIKYTGEVYELKKLDVEKVTEKREDKYPSPLRDKKDDGMIRPSEVSPGVRIGPSYGK
jgi:hypothetical protein